MTHQQQHDSVTVAPPRPLFLLIDIDNTLYEFAETGFDVEMRDAICRFVQDKVGLSAEAANEMCNRYMMSYGLSLYGYVKEHGVDAKAYSDYVHQCSYDKLKYNAALVDMLRRLQFRGNATKTASTYDHSDANQGLHHLYFFTNANRVHARRVLEPLGLRPIFTRPRQVGSPVNEPHRHYDEDGFEADTEWYGFSYEDQWRLTDPDTANKPMRRAYEAVVAAIDDEIARDELALRDSADDAPTAQIPGAPVIAHRRRHLRPENMVMIDDSLRNLVAPLELGWNAVWYAHGADELPAEGPYRAAATQGRLKTIHHILDLEKAINALSSETVVSPAVAP